MEAYARAELTSRESEFRLAAAPPPGQAKLVPLNGGSTAGLASATGPAALASLILGALDDGGLAILARRLLPHLIEPEAAGTVPTRSAYTVASLAAELGVSQKTIRCAITRRELSAVKRGARWIISADAVQEWATASDTRRGRGCSPGSSLPKAAGPSLRSVLCAAGSRGRAR